MIRFDPLTLSCKMKSSNLIGILVVLASLISGCNQSSSAPPVAKTSVVPSPPVDTWLYSSSTDKMTGVTSYHASTGSVNTVSFGFPYAGEQHARVMATANSLILWIERGQVVCHSYGDPCRVLVKFDESEPQYYDWRSIGDDSTTISSFDEKLIKRLYSAKKMTVRLQVYQNGYPDFDFIVADLKPIQKDKKT